MSKMNIRKMTEADISAVYRVDKSAFKKAWSEQSFCDEIKKDYSHYYIAEYNGEIAGFAGIWCIYETAELIRIATTPKFQRCGIADMLMRCVFLCAADCGCERMMLEVRESNTPARNLYKKYNFNEISVRRGYYEGEDAVIMEAAVKQNERYTDIGN